MGTAICTAAAALGDARIRNKELFQWRGCLLGIPIKIE
jgi:hypothetical protein